ncbi:MAG TPA: hypothetical protein VF527_15415 [Pyrinomonadaceae bacterium]|jgi:hypothetical protein
MKFAKILFLVAGIYGLVALLPQYFLEEYNGRNFPPPITHPEYYYGFVGVAVAWQVLFLILAKDPVRFRPMMIPAVLEKLGFGVVAVILYAQQRLSAFTLGAGLIDLILGALFVVAYVKTGDGREPKRT